MRQLFSVLAVSSLLAMVGCTQPVAVKSTKPTNKNLAVEATKPEATKPEATKPAEKPADKPVEKPPEKSADKPADKTPTTPPK